MSATGPVLAPTPAPPSIAFDQETTQTGTIDFEENMYSEVNPRPSTYTDVSSNPGAMANPLPPPPQRQMSGSAAAFAAAPTVPATRGPGHTPRSQGLDSTQPPRRPPSRTSSRYNTPRQHGDEDSAARPIARNAPALVPESSATAAAAAPAAVVRPSVAQSGRTVQYAVEDEAAIETGSLSFQLESSQPANQRRAKQRSVDLPTSEGSDIHFVVDDPNGARGRSASSAAPTTYTAASDIQFVVDEPARSPQLRGNAGGATRAQPRNTTSVDPTTLTDASEIQFQLEASQRASRVPRGSPGVGAQRASLTSVQFEVESANERTMQSSVSRFSIEGEDPAPRPFVPATHLSIDREDEAGEAAGDEEQGQQQQQKDDEIEFLTSSGERKRQKAAEEERRKKALQERSLYMNTRPWETNEPNPRARRTSSQSAARILKQQEAEKQEEIEKRKRSMYARPWRTNSESPNTSRSASAPKRRSSTPTADAQTPRKPPVPRTPTKKRSSSNDKAKPSARTTTRRQPTTPPAAALTPAAKKRAEEDAEAVPQESTPMPTPRAFTRSPARFTRPSTPPAPPKPVFDPVEAAKFVTPAPVLKPPLEVVSDELEEWTQTVSQQRNLQAVLDGMRGRERVIVQLSNQLDAQGRVMARLNTELYRIRDDYVRQYGRDVMGMPLRAPHSPTPSPGRLSGGRPSNTIRLYPEPRHQAKDYYTMKLVELAQSRGSVLSDEELSDGERNENASDLVRWRRERAAMRAEKIRLAQRRRDLAYQMHRGSNIKDISLLRPTSARGPLERAAYGTQTAVDVDGYDKLMELRMDAQRAEVEAANAQKVHEATVTMAATMKKQHDLASPEAQAAKDIRRSAKDMYTAALRRMRQSAQDARPLLDRAAVEMARRERRAAASVELEAEAELQDYSDSVQAVRLKADRLDALATAAGEDEERMLRSASTPRAGTSRATTPRGSMGGGAARPGASTGNDDVFRRLTSRKVHSSTPSIARETTPATK